MVSSSARIVHQRHLSKLWMITVCAITVTLLSGSFVKGAFGAPAKLDAIAPPSNSPFPLEEQPALFTNAFAAALNSDNNNSDGSFNKDQPSAIDSYGNPIEALKPIDTPDGRKVISAQGVQFEIPNYASGITDIKKPADDLLPPFIDPIAVAVPNDSADGTSATGAGLNTDTAATAITTTVDIENAPIIELKSQTDHGQSNGINSLPEYIVALMDPDIAGPVEYMPAEDGSSLKVIAWDLLPPVEGDTKINTAANGNILPKHVTDIEDPIRQNNKIPLATGQNLNNRGNVHYTSSTTTTTPRSTTVRTTRPTTTTTTTSRSKTTTARPSTTTRRAITTTTTTQRATPTSRTTPTTTTTTTTTTTASAPLNPDDFYQLENGDSYTLPSWLADIDDPELDAAVTYIVPENINEYNNDTISRDLLPPLEPYTDLNNIDLPAPSGIQITTPTTTTIRPRTTVATTSKRPISTLTTTRRPAVSTPRPNWVHAHPTTASIVSITKTTRQPSSFNDRFSSNNIAQSQNSKESTSFLSTTTQKPRLTTSAQYSSSFNQNPTTITTSTSTTTPTAADLITSTELANSKLGGNFKFSNSNPFLPIRNSASNPFASGNVAKFTTTTTTTTPATPIEEYPFDSATVPSWLAGFDYPDLAPGVPFVYNDDDSKSAVFNDLLPPSQLNTQATDTMKPVFITSSPTSLNSFQNSPSLSSRNDATITSSSTSTMRTFAFNNFPSKVTTTAKPSSIHNSFAQVPNNNNYNNHNNNYYNQNKAVTLPPVLFNPPTVAGNDASNINLQTDNVNFNNFHDEQQPQLQPAASADEQLIIKIPSSSNFNKNFAAPFETTTTSSSSVDQDFGSSTKTTFTKSNEGKVITNNIFGAASGVTPSKQFGFSTSTTPGQASVQNAFQHSSSNHFVSSSSSFSGSASILNKASTPSAFSTFTSTQQSTNFGGLNNKGIKVSESNLAGSKYTGSFGGSPGVLGNGKIGYAVQADGSIRSPSNGQLSVSAPTAATTAPIAASKPPTDLGIANRAGVASSVDIINKFHGTFGGPPGVLVPFDNV